MTDWLDRAACRDADPETFFPTGTGLLAERQETQAKAVCRRCPVRPECLHWARFHASDDGVWGGFDADERRELRRSRAQRAGPGRRVILPATPEGWARPDMRNAAATVRAAPGCSVQRHRAGTRRDPWSRQLRVHDETFGGGDPARQAGRHPSDPAWRADTSPRPCPDADLRTDRAEIRRT